MTATAGRVPTLVDAEAAPVSAFRRWLAPATFLLFGLIDIFVLGHFAHPGDAQARVTGRRRRAMNPIAARPAAISAYVSGSGTGVVTRKS